MTPGNETGGRRDPCTLRHQLWLHFSGARSRPDIHNLITAEIKHACSFERERPLPANIRATMASLSIVLNIVGGVEEVLGESSHPDMGPPAREGRYDRGSRI